MPESAVDLHVENGVAHLTLNSPHSANALTVPMCESLITHVESIATNPDVSVVLLSGAGERFCAGGDLNFIAGAPNRSVYIGEMVEVAHRLALQLYELDKPVIAAVQGAAAGAGFSLALLADLVIAEKGAKFVTAYTSIGLTPDLGQSWLLPRAVGSGRALEMMLPRSSVSAEQAMEWGIVSRVVDDARVTARETALSLAEGPAGAYGGARRLIRQSFDGFAAHLDLEAESIVSFVAKEEASNLITAHAAGSLQ